MKLPEAQQLIGRRVRLTASSYKALDPAGTDVVICGVVHAVAQHHMGFGRTGHTLVIEEVFGVWRTISISAVVSAQVVS